MYVFKRQTDLLYSPSRSFSGRVTGRFILLVFLVYCSSLLSRSEAQPPEILNISTTTNLAQVEWDAVSSSVYRVRSNQSLQDAVEGWPSSYPLVTATSSTGMVQEVLSIQDEMVVYAIVDTEEFDSDNDGVFDTTELLLGFDPMNPDSDTNGIPDGEEDVDGDGVWVSAELFLETSPTNTDSDGNGTLDGGEDPDGDGLPNTNELILALNPLHMDTDRDAIGDGDEDSDIDGLTNVEELFLGLDPINPDSDGDTWPDGAEVDAGSLPGDPNSTPFILSVSYPTIDVNIVGFGGPGGAALNVIVSRPITQVNIVDPGSTSPFEMNVIVSKPPVTITIQE